MGYKEETINNIVTYIIISPITINQIRTWINNNIQYKKFSYSYIISGSKIIFTFNNKKNIKTFITNFNKYLDTIDRESQISSNNYKKTNVVTIATNNVQSVSNLHKTPSTLGISKIYHVINTPMNLMQLLQTKIDANIKFLLRNIGIDYELESEYYVNPPNGIPYGFDIPRVHGDSDVLKLRRNMLISNGIPTRCLGIDDYEINLININKLLSHGEQDDECDFILCQEFGMGYKCDEDPSNYGMMIEFLNDRLKESKYNVYLFGYNRQNNITPDGNFIYTDNVFKCLAIFYDKRKYTLLENESLDANLDECDAFLSFNYGHPRDGGPNMRSYDTHINLKENRFNYSECEIQSQNMTKNVLFYDPHYYNISVPINVNAYRPVNGIQSKEDDPNIDLKYDLEFKLPLAHFCQLGYFQNNISLNIIKIANIHIDRDNFLSNVINIHKQTNRYYPLIKYCASMRALSKIDVDIIAGDLNMHNNNNKTITGITTLLGGEFGTFKNMRHIDLDNYQMLYSVLRNGQYINPDVDLIKFKFRPRTTTNTGLYCKEQFSNKSDIEILGGNFLKKNYSIHPPYLISL